VLALLLKQCAPTHEPPLLQPSRPAWVGPLCLHRRGAILDKASQIIAGRMDELAATLTREEGRTRRSRGEAIRARGPLPLLWRRRAAVMVGAGLPAVVNGERLHRPRPLGVVSILYALGNFPLAIPDWKIARPSFMGNHCFQIL